MQEPLDDLLDLYPGLSPDERRALDGRVRQEHPEGLPRHDEARRLAALFDAARAEHAQDAHAQRLLDTVFGKGDPESLSGDERATLEALLPADPLGHFRALDARVRAAHPDPFLDAPARTGLRAPDRASRPRASRPRPVWARAYAYAAFALLVVSSLAVWAGMRPPLGDFSAEELAVQGYGPVRGADAGEAAGSPDQRYLRALAEVEAARTSTLGLFVRYDHERLAAARALLEGVAQDAAAGDFLRLEALYALGKTHLLLGDRAAAEQALRQVVDGQGSHAREAEALLRRLRKGTPA